MNIVQLAKAGIWILAVLMAALLGGLMGWLMGKSAEYVTGLLPEAA